MTATIESAPVIDCPEFVFRNHVTEPLNVEFMDYAQVDLTEPAIRTLTRLLNEEWTRGGFTMVTIGYTTFSRILEIDFTINSGILPDCSVATRVWDAVVERLDMDAIVDTAQLTREYAAFVRAQPDYNH